MTNVQAGPDARELLRMAVDAAAEAGRLLASWRGDGRPEVVQTKSSPTDVVTEMDRRSEALITGRIRAVRPGDTILGEEGGQTAGAAAIGDQGSGAFGSGQVRWVIDRLRANPAARDATITTFQPLTDTGYIPCISLLDFWLVDGKLQFAVYAHSIDFGTKGYANLVELAALQTRMAGDLAAAVGTLTMTVKSAHIYETELDLMRRVIGTDSPG